MISSPENLEGPASSKVTRKAFVLLSGGLDSTTCLYKAINDYSGKLDISAVLNRILLNREVYKTKANTASFDPIPWVEAVSVNYGQRHTKELECAHRLCMSLGINHTILNLMAILDGSMLTDPSKPIPSVSYDELPHGVSPTYVPFRNGLLLSMITAHAQKWVNAGHVEFSKEFKSEVFPGEVLRLKSITENREAGIYFGAHAEDAHNWAYPDCTPEFIGAMANAIYIGSYKAIRLHTPLQWMRKSDVIGLGSLYDVPFEETWSCYKGEEKHCGVCPTCRSRRQAFIETNVNDPTEYAATP